MPILRDGLARVWKSVRQVSDSDQAEGAPGASRTGVYARVRPATVRLTERYNYVQEISQNPQRRMTDSPKGAVKLQIPYDGHNFFTRQAGKDVAISAPRQALSGSLSALIGHLLIANYNYTNLGMVLGLGQNYGSIPIRVPVGVADGIGDLNELRADRKTCVISHDYAPDANRMRVTPITVEADLFDPDSIWSQTESTSPDINGGDLMQQVSFRSHLILNLAVSITLPKGATDNDQIQARITNVSVGWPTVTSLRNVHLINGERPVQYNPLTRRIEWANITMERVESDADDLLRFCTKPGMFLMIEQPGDLYQQQELDGTVKVRVDNYLLSGTEARLADGTGHLPVGGQPKCITYLSVDVRVRLDDAFSKRYMTPYQHLHFDEVIPEDARIADIVSALKDRGFTVHDNHAQPAEKAFLVAKRSEGPDEMVLELLVRGRRMQTERQSRRPGGQTFKTTLESGELDVFVRGKLRRDSRALTREMNALQQALRENFVRVRRIR